jgi:hypothetical protein
MSALVNNHHLLPILADWNSAVSFALTWDTEVDPALRGSEARAAFRRWPRPELKFQAATRGAVETNDLRLRLAAALRVDHITPANTDGKTGRVCVPWAGRESWISEYSVSGSTATIELSAIPFAWAVGDYAVTWSVCTGETWALHHITAIASLVITTTIVEVSGAHTPVAGDMISPLFYGRLNGTPIELRLDTPVSGSIPLQVAGESYIVDETAWPPEGEDDGEPDLPVAMFTGTPSNLVVAFDGSASTSDVDVPLVGWEWDFGDGDAGTGATTSHAYLHSGTYVVTLTVRDQLGRRASVSHSFDLLADPVEDWPGPPDLDPLPDPDPDPATVTPDAPPVAPEDYPYPGEIYHGVPIFPPTFGA